MIIIYYGKDIDKKTEMNHVLDSMQIKYYEAGDDQIRSLMKNINHSSESLEGSHALFLYFIEETHQTVMELEKRLSFPIPRKAMQNELNQNWKLEELMAEIEKEAYYFEKREYLYELIQKADIKRMETDEEYAQLMGASYGLFEQEDAPVDLLEFAIQLIEKSSLKK